MQRIEYQQKPMRVPDRGCTVRKRMELQRMLVALVIAVSIAAVLVSAVVTGLRHTVTASTLETLPSNVVIVEVE